MSIKNWTAIGCQIPGQALGEGFQQVEETVLFSEERSGLTCYLSKPF